jgi:hypothetical protein
VHCIDIAIGGFALKIGDVPRKGSGHGSKILLTILANSLINGFYQESR